jgi:hypothetical protein
MLVHGRETHARIIFFNNFEICSTNRDSPVSYPIMLDLGLSPADLYPTTTKIAWQRK